MADFYLETLEVGSGNFSREMFHVKQSLGSVAETSVSRETTF
jgi:hypothetical protein